MNSVDPHPAGRVALSVGQDRMLRMWDLLAGKAVATLKMEKEGEVVRWSSDGNKFAVAGHGHLTLYALVCFYHFKSGVFFLLLPDLTGAYVCRI